MIHKIYYIFTGVNSRSIALSNMFIITNKNFKSIFNVFFLSEELQDKI